MPINIFPKGDRTDDRPYLIDYFPIFGTVAEFSRLDSLDARRREAGY